MKEEMARGDVPGRLKETRMRAAIVAAGISRWERLVSLERWFRLENQDEEAVGHHMEPL